MRNSYQESFYEFLQSLRMTLLSLEVWADTPEKKYQVHAKVDTIRSMIELGDMLYNNAQKEKQSV